MLVLPHSGLFIGPSLTVVISGPHIQVLDTLYVPQARWDFSLTLLRTGDVRHSTKNDNGAVKSGPVRCFAVDNAGKHLLSSGEDKVLKLWEIEGLKLVNQRYGDLSMKVYTERDDRHSSGSYQKDRLRCSSPQTGRRSLFLINSGMSSGKPVNFFFSPLAHNGFRHLQLSVPLYSTSTRRKSTPETTTA